MRLLAATGVAGIGIDATLPVFSGPTAVPAALDALGEVWDAGIPLLLGLVPAVPRRRAAEPGHEPRAEPADADPADLGPDGPATGSVLRALARRAFDLADRLGFDRSRLADLAVPTPTCGLAGADPGVGAAGDDPVPGARPGVRGPAGDLVNGSPRAPMIARSPRVCREPQPSVTTDTRRP